MWIGQRVGNGTTVIAPLWAYPLGLCVLAGVAEKVLEKAWPFLVFGGLALFVLYVAYLIMRHYGERSATVGRLAQRFRERE